MYRLGLSTKVQSQLLCLVLLLLMTAAKPAHAIAPECHNYSLCRDFEAKAQDALDRGDLKQALAAYCRAYDVVQDPALQLNIGRIHHRLGHLERARELYGMARRAAPGDARVQMMSSEYLHELDLAAREIATKAESRPLQRIAPQSDAVATSVAVNQQSVPVSQKFEFNLHLPAANPAPRAEPGPAAEFTSLSKGGGLALAETRRRPSGPCPAGAGR